MVTRPKIAFQMILSLMIGLMSICPTVAEDKAMDFGLVILGTGTPNADPHRSGPSVAVIVGDKSYIVDSGPGIVRRAAAASEKGIDALSPPKLVTAFLSHLHTDHTVGLADLIFTPWVLERAVPLALIGPPGTKAMTDHLLKAYAADIEMRLEGLEPANEQGYKVDVTEVDKQAIVFEDEAVTVEAIPVLHGSWKYSFGYKFTHQGKVIVISGDARPSPALITAAQGADILVHEVYSSAGFKKRPPLWQKYHGQFHTSTAELAEIARQTQPKLLVLYHQLYWGFSDQDLIDEVRAAGYEGKVVSARDLDVYSVGE